MDLMGTTMTAIGRKAVIWAISLGLSLLIASSISACAESDSFEFQPQEKAIVGKQGYGD